MFSRLPRHVIADVLRVLGFALAVITGVFFIGSLYVSVREGISAVQILRIAPFLIPYPLPYVLPFSLLLSAALVYGRLAGDNELTAIRASGIHMGRIILPVLVLGLGVGAVSLWLSDHVIPACAQKKNDVVKAAWDSLLHLRKGENFDVVLGRHSLHIDRYEGRRFEGVVLSFPEDERVVRIVAERGELLVAEGGQSVVLSLEGASAASYDPATGREVSAGTAASIAYPLDVRRKSPRPEALSTRAMRRELRAVRRVLGGGASPVSFPLSGFERSVDGAFLRAGWAAGRRFESVTLGYRDGEHWRMIRAAWALVARGPEGSSIELHQGTEGAIPDADAEPDLVRPFENLVFGAGAPPPVEALLADVDQWFAERYAPLQARLTSELARRKALALGCLTFLLVGIPIPILVPHPNRLVPFFLGLILVVFLFFVPFYLGYQMARDGVLTGFGIPAQWGPWLGNLVLAPVGAWLTFRVFRA